MGRRRGFPGCHLQRERFGGHRAVVAFRQQGVVGGMFRLDFQAMIGKRIDFLHHGRDVHGLGVLDAVADPRSFARRDNSRTGIELQNPHRPGRPRRVDPGAAIGPVHHAQPPHGDQQTHRGKHFGERREQSHSLLLDSTIPPKDSSAVTCYIMPIRIVQVDAFTAHPFSGNPAAVCHPCPQAGRH